MFSQLSLISLCNEDKVAKCRDNTFDKRNFTHPAYTMHTKEKPLHIVTHLGPLKTTNWPVAIHLEVLLSPQFRDICKYKIKRFLLVFLHNLGGPGKKWQPRKSTTGRQSLNISFGNVTTECTYQSCYTDKELKHCSRCMNETLLKKYSTGN